MKTSRLLLAGVLFGALLGNGCIITSAQILVHFDLPDPVIIDATDNMENVDVDLTTISDYQDNKDKLKGLNDLAILGTFVNTAGPAGTVTVYISPTYGQTYANAAAVIAGATKLWGPVSVGAAGTPGGTVTLSWDASAALFNPAGKKILLDEAKGDGQFTIFTVGTPGGAYAIDMHKGALVLSLDAGL